MMKLGLRELKKPLELRAGLRGSAQVASIPAGASWVTSHLEIQAFHAGHKPAACHLQSSDAAWVAEQTPAVCKSTRFNFVRTGKPSTEAQEHRHRGLG